VPSAVASGLDEPHPAAERHTTEAATAVHRPDRRPDRRRSCTRGRGVVDVLAAVRRRSVMELVLSLPPP
jgi:hypothetical protein